MILGKLGNPSGDDVKNLQKLLFIYSKNSKSPFLILQQKD